MMCTTDRRAFLSGCDFAVKYFHAILSFTEDKMMSVKANMEPPRKNPRLPPTSPIRQVQSQISYSVS